MVLWSRATAAVVFLSNPLELKQSCYSHTYVVGPSEVKGFYFMKAGVRLEGGVIQLEIEHTPSEEILCENCCERGRTFTVCCGGLPCLLVETVSNVIGLVDTKQVKFSTAKATCTMNASGQEDAFTNDTHLPITTMSNFYSLEDTRRFYSRFQ